MGRTGGQQNRSVTTRARCFGRAEALGRSLDALLACKTLVNPPSAFLHRDAGTTMSKKSEHACVAGFVACTYNHAPISIPIQSKNESEPVSVPSCILLSCVFLRPPIVQSGFFFICARPLMMSFRRAYHTPSIYNHIVLSYRILVLCLPPPRRSRRTINSRNKAQIRKQNQEKHHANYHAHATTVHTQPPPPNHLENHTPLPSHILLRSDQF